MKRLLSFLWLGLGAALAQEQSHVDLGAVRAAMTSRQQALEQVLLDKKVYETVGGMVAANWHRGLPTTEVQSLVAAENADRQALYTHMAEQAGAGTSWQDIGRERMNRYTTRLMAGILRQDPRSQLLIDRWPTPVQNLQELLDLCFAKLDQRGRRLRSGDEQKPSATDTTDWENARTIIERMHLRLPTLLALIENQILTEGEEGLIKAAQAELSGENEKVVKLENSDRQDLYEMIALQMSDPGVNKFKVGQMRAQMKVAIAAQP